MWTATQLERLRLESAIFVQAGLTQFSINHDASKNSYYASGYATSSSGNRYYLYIPIPTGFPNERPPMYLTDPHPLLMRDGTRISSLGVSHIMHTLDPYPNGMIQLCHWRQNKWHAKIYLYQVLLKGLLWIEAYEQHLATGRPLADFVLTMSEA
jgi:hypothetical protein